MPVCGWLVQLRSCDSPGQQVVHYPCGLRGVSGGRDSATDGGRYRGWVVARRGATLQGWRLSDRLLMVPQAAELFLGSV